MSNHIEKDGKHYFWCLYCGKHVEVDRYHNCEKNKVDDKKPYKGSL